MDLPLAQVSSGSGSQADFGRPQAHCPMPCKALTVAACHLEAEACEPVWWLSASQELCAVSLHCKLVYRLLMPEAWGLPGIVLNVYTWRCPNSGVGMSLLLLFITQTKQFSHVCQVCRQVCPQHLLSRYRITKARKP